MPAHFAKPFFSFEKCQRILQKHFSFLRNASAFCKGIFQFWKMPAHFVGSRKNAMNLFFYQQERHAIKLLSKATSTILSLDGLLATSEQRKISFIINMIRQDKLIFLTQRRKVTPRVLINNTRTHETRYTLQLHFSHDGHSQLRTMADG
jgi:hypothetical protein